MKRAVVQRPLIVWLKTQESQTIVLRGVVRPGDISFTNTVPSTSLSDLELELKGKGVVSDAVRQPNLFVRLLMKLVNF